MVIQPLVEGHGEVEAVPVLLRRLQATAEEYGFKIARPFRRKRSELTAQASVHGSVQLALGTPDCAGIIIMFDSDDDPACVIGPNVQAWAQSAAGHIPCEVVAVTREYEAWFISAVESLRGVRGVSLDAVSHVAPETVRDAKGALRGAYGAGGFLFTKCRSGRSNGGSGSCRSLQEVSVFSEDGKSFWRHGGGCRNTCCEMATRGLVALCFSSSY